MPQHSKVEEIINPDTVFERVDGDKELLAELVKIFFETSPELIAQIGKAISTGDSKKLALAAHSLKGSVGTFAAESVYETAAQLELLAREGNLERANQVRVVLEEELQKLKPVLKNLVQKIGA